MEFTRCLRCMKETANYPCPHCGYDPRADKPKEYVLRPGTILNGKYVVGTPLGQGGFGITYIGWDLLLDNQVAIKEYFPSGQVGRSTTGALQWYSTPQAENARNSGKEMFLKEARKMSRVGSIPQVVHIRDLFQQNDTAYIVMDFVEGETLMDRLKKTGPLSWEDARKIFFPAIRAMEQVHQAGLVHRDLSPDNLMLLPDGSVKILDLGAAKDLNVNSGASSMQVAKSGFSPLEQYTQRGGSGPWSDVYAMAATLYYSLTGVLPPPVMDRMEDDQIRWELPGLTALSAPALEALKKATVLLAKDRTQTMGEFLRQLEDAPTKQKPTSKPKKKLSPLPIIAAVLVVALMVGWALWPSNKTEPHSAANVATSHANEDALSLTIKKQTICAGGNGTVALKSDGTVINTKDPRNVLNWEDIVSISTNGFYTVGLKANGTVVAAYPQSSTRYSTIDDRFSDWKNIVEIDSRYQDVALVADGTVISNHDTSEWSQIVSVSAGEHHVVGLKADGTVLATKVDSSSLDRGQSDVSDWKDIVALSAGANHTVGLKADGTVVATGDSRHGQCAVSDWQDIIAISAGDYHTVGLKSDGTVVATKITATWSRIDYRQSNVSDWTDIAAISAGIGHTVGLKVDGTVVATGHNEDGQCNVSDWTDIHIPGTIS